MFTIFVKSILIKKENTMNKAFFIVLMLNGCIYASQPTESTSLFTRKDSYNSHKIDVESIIQSAKKNNSNPALTRVKRQSFGSQDFMNPENDIKFRKKENITEATFKKSESK